jgi:hypothetical protein
MTNDIYIKPTWLMIKRHEITGLRYFCKTIRTDKDKYKGSGVRWTRHINKHGKEHVINELIIGPYTNKEEIRNLALYMSEELNVVNSSDWANLKPEDGVMGGATTNGRVWTDEEKEKARIAKSGENHPMFGKKQSRETAEKRNAKNRGQKRTKEQIENVKNGRKNSKKEKKKTVRLERLCPVCNFIGKGPNMARYHFNNCKLRKV